MVTYATEDGKMSGLILRGAGKEIGAVPDADFRAAINCIPGRMQPRLAFMTPAHHAVRDFVVTQIPRQREPVTPGQIARAAGLALSRVRAIVAELEKHLFFLVRDRAGNVSWAFPVTSAETRHRLEFSTGEKTFGA